VSFGVIGCQFQRNFQKNSKNEEMIIKRHRKDHRRITPGW